MAPRADMQPQSRQVATDNSANRETSNPDQTQKVFFREKKTDARQIFREYVFSGEEHE